jgi:acyl carrier protein
MPSENDLSLKLTLARVLGIGTEEIDDRTSMDTIAAWDSLTHLNLLLATEQQFGVALPEDEAFAAVSYPLLRAALAQQGVVFAA